MLTCNRCKYCIHAKHDNAGYWCKKDHSYREKIVKFAGCDYFEKSQLDLFETSKEGNEDEDDVRT